MSRGASDMPRLDELLADEATQGLDTSERAELERLLGQTSHVDREAFEWSAAAAALAFSAGTAQEALPPALHTRLAHAADQRVSRGPQISAPASPTPEATPVTTPAANTSAGVLRFPAGLPWILAAASILLAIFAWWPKASPDVELRRQALLETPDARTIEWSDAVGAGVTGDIVWSNDRQSGFMRFTNLAANDPTKMQYQLWIFDGERQVYDAVDGGVFDVDEASGTVVVEVDPKLKVFTPTLFAVTTEPPGGVVKHDPALDPERFKIILTAQPSV